MEMEELPLLNNRAMQLKYGHCLAYVKCSPSVEPIILYKSKTKKLILIDSFEIYFWKIISIDFEIFRFKEKIIHII